MFLSRINDLFKQKITLEDFQKEIENEIVVYRVELGKKGGSSSIQLNEDIKNLLVKEQDIKLLCNAFLSNRLNKWELNYIGEGLLLSEKIDFENDKVKEALLAIADPEYYKLVNAAYIKDILGEMG
jgi:DNA integrity scanning protein DisA with diadenylate cyclase activity